VESDQFEVSLIGRNLSNVVTFTGASQIPVSSGGTAAATIDPPREISAQVVYRF
jgi:hypothetical protein